MRARPVSRSSPRCHTSVGEQDGIHPFHLVPLAGHNRAGHPAPRQPAADRGAPLPAFRVVHADLSTLGRVGGDLCAGVRTDPRRETVVVGMGLRNDDADHLTQSGTRARQTAAERVPNLVGVPAEIDHDDAGRVAQRVREGVGQRTGKGNGRGPDAAAHGEAVEPPRRTLGDRRIRGSHMRALYRIPPPQAPYGR